MVTDNRSAGPWQPVEYEGYEPLPIVALKVHMLGESESGKPEGLLRIITDGGIEGWCNTIDPETARVITTQFREHLIGRDALARERLWHDLVMLERLTWPPTLFFLLPQRPARPGLSGTCWQPWRISRRSVHPRAATV